MRWQQGLMGAGAVLLTYELIMQAVRFVVESRLVTSKVRDAMIVAAIQRLGLGLLISWLVFLQLLKSWRVLAEHQRAEYPHVYIEFWPDLMLAIAIFAALRVLTVWSVPARDSLPGKLMKSSVMLVGMGLLAVFVLSDRAEDVALAHFASDEQEIMTALSWQREAFFLRDNADRYHTFWMSVLAASGIALAAAFLWIHPRLKQPLVRPMVLIVLFLLGSCSTSYGTWFLWREFPRISPDLANAGSPRIWSDTLAGLMLLMGLAVTFGLHLAETRACTRPKVLNWPSLSVEGVFAIYLIAVASAWNANVLLCQFAISESPRSILAFLVWFLPLPNWSSWQNYIGTLAEAMLQPEMLVTLMLFVAALSLVWQNWRRPEVTFVLRPVYIRQVVAYTFASLALVSVAIPTLMVFAFCYWLGPIVL